MNKAVTSLTLALLATAGIAGAGLCDEVSQSKQTETTAHPDGSVTQSTAEQTDVQKDSAPVPMPRVSSTTTETKTETVKPLPARQVTKTKQTATKSGFGGSSYTESNSVSTPDGAVSSTTQVKTR